jgi:proteic killer suppression protein
VIAGFRAQETERIWRGAFSRALAHDIQSTALRKLRMLNNAQVLQDSRRAAE